MVSRGGSAEEAGSRVMNMLLFVEDFYGWAMEDVMKPCMSVRAADKESFGQR